MVWFLYRGFFKMLKFASFFVVAVCLLQSSFATSVAKRETETTSIPNVIQSTAEKIFKDLDASLKNATKSVEWIAFTLKQLGDNIFTDVSKSLGGYFVGFVLRIDLFGRVGGYQIGLSKDSDRQEKEYQVTAVTVCEMYSKLEKMALIDGIITNTSVQAAEDFIGQKSKYNKHSGTYFFYKKLDEAMAANSKLRDDYAKLKSEVKSKSLPKLTLLYDSAQPETAEIWEQKTDALLGHKDILPLVINRVFIQSASEHLSLLFSENEFKRYAFAGGMLYLAANSKSKMEKVQNIYNRSVEKVVQKWKASDSRDMACELADLLFSALYEVAENEPTVFAELVVFQDKAKELARFDLKMLNVNLLPF